MIILRIPTTSEKDIVFVESLGLIWLLICRFLLIQMIRQPFRAFTTQDLIPNWLNYAIFILMCSYFLGLNSTIMWSNTTIL